MVKTDERKSFCDKNLKYSIKKDDIFGDEIQKNE